MCKVNITTQIKNEYIKPKLESTSFSLPRSGHDSSFGIDKTNILSKLNKSFSKIRTWEDEGDIMISDSSLTQTQINKNTCNKVDLDSSACLCNICFEHESDCIFMPCGHGGVCLSCTKDVVKVQSECYLCRGAIEYVLRYNNSDKKEDMFKITELHQFE